MRDPFSWSLPLPGRIFGITVRIHFLFLLFILIMWLKALSRQDLPGYAWAMLMLMGLVFVSVLLHEFGHCFAARWVDGDAREVLLWPLGGLANCEVPHTPRANFICAAGGPAVNLLLCVISGSVLAACALVPPFNPNPQQVWSLDLYNFQTGVMYHGQFGESPHLEYWQILVAQFFWVNWFGFLLNVLLFGFPLDGGRMLQAVLWTRLGYRQSMVMAIIVGFLVMLVVGVYALVTNELMVLCLAGFIYFSCKAEWFRLETGGEESLFGYDFSQGYTSLERDQPPPPRRKRQNFFQRWLQRRAAKKMQREQDRHDADEQRMDELLTKILQQGKSSLTDEEQRFMKRVADKKKNQS